MATVVLKVLSSLFISVLHHYFSDYVAFFADKYMLALKTPITHTHRTATTSFQVFQKHNCSHYIYKTRQPQPHITASLNRTNTHT